MSFLKDGWEFFTGAFLGGLVAVLTESSLLDVLVWIPTWIFIDLLLYVGKKVFSGRKFKDDKPPQGEVEEVYG